MTPTIRAAYRDAWWVFGEPRRELRPALNGLNRYLATVETAKHRVFQFLPSEVLPDNKLQVIAIDDALVLGGLSSGPHLVWALAAGGKLGVGNDPVYVKSRCFDPFPFPRPNGVLHDEIAALAEELDGLRKLVLSTHADLTLTTIYVAAQRESALVKNRTEQNRNELGDYALTATKAAIARLDGITVLADDVAKLATFYRDALGLRVDVTEQNYVAFGGEGIRLAIFSRIGMSPNTHDHPDYRTQFTGQAFELNFECASTDDVNERFSHIVANGGRSIADPTKKHWGHFTGFFADPEGNIHSLFAVLAE